MSFSSGWHVGHAGGRKLSLLGETVGRCTKQLQLLHAVFYHKTLHLFCKTPAISFKQTPNVLNWTAVSAIKFVNLMKLLHWCNLCFSFFPQPYIFVSDIHGTSYYIASSVCLLSIVIPSCVYIFACVQIIENLYILYFLLLFYTYFCILFICHFYYYSSLNLMHELTL